MQDECGIRCRANEHEIDVKQNEGQANINKHKQNN